MFESPLFVRQDHLGTFSTHDGVSFLLPSEQSSPVPSTGVALTTATQRTDWRPDVLYQIHTGCSKCRKKTISMMKCSFKSTECLNRAYRTVTAGQYFYLKVWIYLGQYSQSIRSKWFLVTRTIRAATNVNLNKRQVGFLESEKKTITIASNKQTKPIG